MPFQGFNRVKLKLERCSVTEVFGITDYIDCLGIARLPYNIDRSTGRNVT